MTKSWVLSGLVGLGLVVSLTAPVFACTTQASANYSAQTYSTMLDGSNIGVLTGVVRGFTSSMSSGARLLTVQGWGSYWWNAYPYDISRPDGHIQYEEFAVSDPKGYMDYGSVTPTPQAAWSPPAILTWAIGLIPGGGAIDSVISNSSVSSVNMESQSSTFYQQSQYPSNPQYAVNTDPDCTYPSDFMEIPLLTWHVGDSISSDFQAHYITGNFSQGIGYTDTSGWIYGSGTVQG